MKGHLKNVLRWILPASGIAIILLCVLFIPETKETGLPPEIFSPSQGVRESRAIGGTDQDPHKDQRNEAGRLPEELAHETELGKLIQHVQFFGANVYIPETFRHVATDSNDLNMSAYQQWFSVESGRADIQFFVLANKPDTDFDTAVAKQKEVILDSPDIKVAIDEPDFFSADHDEYTEYVIFYRAGDNIIMIWCVSYDDTALTLEDARAIQANITLAE